MTNAILLIIAGALMEIAAHYAKVREVQYSFICNLIVAAVLQSWGLVWLFQIAVVGH